MNLMHGATRLLAIAISAFGLLCNVAGAAELAAYEEVGRYKLAKQVSESSGLACTDERLFVINDSGNEPNVYELDHQGQIQATFPMIAPSRDWEAMTTDGQRLFIADIGNNHGVNRQLQIYHLPLTALHPSKPGMFEQINFSFADFELHPIEPMRHDLDAEAIALNGNDLMLFSKSWQTNRTRVYRVAQLPASQLQLLSPIATIADLPGMVTGAHYDAAEKSYWLVGYNSKGLPKMTPFVARLSEAFEVLEVKLLPGLGQIEAVCIDEQRTLWMAQEQLIFTPALLLKYQAGH
ncbi:hypothetical protein K0504_00820 [Neiella marina]|uniref:Phytase-like domain-containing protein n=1 Tax=Neiella holothuriorum TaxID=2870530 RepID=A0ABS7EB50_9GAMM|nr:hypothetical protein [Neiella holothuriorum]MBW8189561.1 hypothetical protein [Neiella holothuriorum]